MMEDAVPTRMYPSLDESFSDLSGFSFDNDKVGWFKKGRMSFYIDKVGSNY